MRRILIGPHLAGLRVHGEHLYPAAWPAILSADTHHALRTLLTDLQRKTHRTLPTRHLWSGFLVCGHCGVRMYAYYRPAKHGPVKTLRCHRKLGGCGRLARAWPALPFYARRRILETLIARVTLLPTGRGCRHFDPSSVRIDWTF